MFDPACICCGARIIQMLGNMPLTQADCRARRRAQLAAWVEQGHDEAEIRRLVAGPWCVGPLVEPVPESVSPVKAKRRAK
jgi:hypothetical protein